MALCVQNSGNNEIVDDFPVGNKDGLSIIGPQAGIEKRDPALSRPIPPGFKPRARSQIRPQNIARTGFGFILQNGARSHQAEIKLL